LAKSHKIIFVDGKRKHKVPEPVKISLLQRVKVIKILGVTITNGLSASPHVQSVIASCAQVLYALLVLCAHSLCDSALHTIYLLSLPNCSMHLVPGRVLPKLQIGTKFNLSSKKSKRNGYCSPDLPDFNNLCTSKKVDLFNKVLKIPIHVLHPLLPPPVSHTQRYGLRPSAHDRTLPERTSNLVDCNFIIRMLYLKYTD